MHTPEFTPLFTPPKVPAQPAAQYILTPHGLSQVVEKKPSTITVERRAQISRRNPTLPCPASDRSIVPRRYISVRARQVENDGRYEKTTLVRTEPGASALTAFGPAHSSLPVSVHTLCIRRSDRPYR